MQVFIEPFNFNFFSISGQGIDLDYSDIEWFALKTSRDHSVIFEIASKYCISDSLVDYDSYSITETMVTKSRLNNNNNKNNETQIGILTDFSKFLPV